MSEAVAYGALASSFVALFGVLYGWGYKMGAMQTKIDCLWQIYVKDALSETRRKHGNPKPIDLKALFTQSIKLQIEKLGLCNRRQPPTDTDLVFRLEKELGQQLSKLAEENNLPYRVVLGTALLIARELNEHPTG